MAKAKKAKVEDHRGLNDEALAAKVGDEIARLKKTKFSHAVNPIENPLTIRLQRRAIARMKTEQRKRALGL